MSKFSGSKFLNYVTTVKYLRQLVSLRSVLNDCRLLDHTCTLLSFASLILSITFLKSEYEERGEGSLYILSQEMVILQRLVD